MSASKSPTFAPCAAQANAKLAAVVDLPTPPLPDATATTFLTFVSGFSVRCTACAVICALSFSSSLAFPSAGPRCDRSADSISGP